MKRQTGIWIDISKAIIVTLNEGKEKILEIDSAVENRIYHDKEGEKGTFSGTHHGSNETTFYERKKNQLNLFFKDILSHIRESDELYVFGPADTKTKLEHKLYDEKSFDASKLKLVETADSMTSNQIVAKVKEFYNK